MIEFQNVSKIYKGGKVAVEDVNLSFEKGEFICFIGTSGSGKTTTMRMINRMTDPTQGKILIDGKSIQEIDPVELRRQIGYVIQSIGLMPHMTIRENITLVQKLLKVSQEERNKTAEKMIDLVELPREMLDRYPHELSGGMRQRVMIAMALAGNPKLIIADEPTTALDVTIQAQILELLKDIQKRSGCAIMLITHDLGVIAEMADEVVVMYAGRVIEKGTVREVFHNPLHPYTIGLQKSKPLINSNTNEPLYSIPGQVPNPINMPDTCFFRGRCNKCIKKCSGKYPSEVYVSDTHMVACYLYDKEGKENE